MESSASVIATRIASSTILALNPVEWFFRYFIWDHVFYHAVHLNAWSKFPRPPLTSVPGFLTTDRSASIDILLPRFASMKIDVAADEKGAVPLKRSRRVFPPVCAQRAHDKAICLRREAARPLLEYLTRRTTEKPAESFCRIAHY